MPYTLVELSWGTDRHREVGVGGGGVHTTGLFFLVWEGGGGYLASGHLNTCLALMSVCYWNAGYLRYRVRLLRQLFRGKKQSHVFQEKSIQVSLGQTSLRHCCHSDPDGTFTLPQGVHQVTCREKSDAISGSCLLLSVPPKNSTQFI